MKTEIKEAKVLWCDKLGEDGMVLVNGQSIYMYKSAILQEVETGHHLACTNGKFIKDDTKVLVVVYDNGQVSMIDKCMEFDNKLSLKENKDKFIRLTEARNSHFKRKFA